MGMLITKWGWVAGAGMEWIVSERWSLGAEYLYAGLGKPLGLRPVYH